MQIPSSFHDKIIGCFGNEGNEWLEILESRVQVFLEKWNLIYEGPVTNLSYNYVLKATDLEGKPVILKLGVPNFDFQNEIRTLQAYDGRGCAKLLKADPKLGAMLLDRLVPGRMLSEVEDEEFVIKEYISVWTALRRPAPEEITFPTIMNWADGLERYRETNEDGPIPKDLINLAAGYFQELTETSEGAELLHGDLHHENILLSNDHGWMAIDPKGLVGDPYFDLISFLINHLHNKINPKALLKRRIDLLCEEMKLNRERLLKAAVAMGTLYACWGIEDNDSDWIYTYNCVQWFQDLRRDNIDSLQLHSSF